MVPDWAFRICDFFGELPVAVCSATRASRRGRSQAGLGESPKIADGWWRGADSNPRDPSGFEGRNSTRVWRTIRPEQKDPRRRLSESAVALLEMWDGKSCWQEILRSMRECFHCFKNARDPGA